MIKIDYGDKEALLFSLYDKAEALNSSTSSDMFSFDFLGEKYEITQEQKQIADQIIAIEKEAVANAIKYYSTRLDELADDLKGDIELRIILGQHTLTDFAELTPFLDLLTEKSPELHKQIIHFTVETFRNKDKLMKTPYAQLVMKKFSKYLNGSKIAPFTHNGDAIEALALARSKGKIKPHAQLLEVNGVNIFAPESALKIGPGAVKIFRYAVTEFTKRNHCNADDGRLKLCYVLDVKDFAEANGIDTENADDMKNFRRKLADSLKKLSAATITWSEKIKGQSKTFAGLNYIGSYNLKGNELMIEFTLSMAQYLTSLPLIKYPRSLYALDDRDYNAYAIGEAMCIHYSQENNVVRGTEDKLRVETLLQSTSYPSYEEIKTHEMSWVQKVKEPFESALDKLTQCGLIADWVYCHEGGIELTDKEAAAIAERGYAYFASLLVKFTLNDFESHEERTTAIQEKKAKQLEKAKRKKKRKKDNSEE